MRYVASCPLTLPDFIYDDEGHSLTGGTIISKGYGVIGCRLCGRFERMQVYQVQWGSRSHFFGLHDQCAMAYFKRMKEGDIIALIEVERLACLGGQKYPKAIFTSERIK